MIPWVRNSQSFASGSGGSGGGGGRSPKGAKKGEGELRYEKRDEEEERRWRSQSRYREKGINLVGAILCYKCASNVDTLLSTWHPWSRWIPRVPPYLGPDTKNIY
jgi:hypothetical protein